jgi:hypothetical protein
MNAMSHAKEAERIVRAVKDEGEEITRTNAILLALVHAVLSLRQP